jgi:hypothetical protein
VEEGEGEGASEEEERRATARRRSLASATARREVDGAGEEMPGRQVPGEVGDVRLPLSWKGLSL